MYVIIKPIEAEDGLGEWPTNGILILLINPLSVHAGVLCIVLDSRTGLRERKMICTRSFAINSILIISGEATALPGSFRCPEGVFDTITA